MICFPQVKDLDCEGLFGNIESVLKTSQKLLASLENAVDNTKGNDQELGNVLTVCPWMLVLQWFGQFQAFSL